MRNLRHLTTNSEEAAALAALGYVMSGGHVIDADEARALRELGDRRAREGSVAFAIVVPDEHAEDFAAALPAARTGDCHAHLRVYRETIHRCRNLIHELTV